MKTALLICVLVLIIILLLKVFESQSVFFPQKYPVGYWQPQTYGLNLEDCSFQASDEMQLHGWFLKVEDAKATILWSHGNAGNITDRLDNLAKLASLPFNVFIYDYRGYGKSEGKPSEAGVYQDAEAAYNYLLTRPEVDPDKIVIYGRSLGGAVAMDLAVKKPSRCLILESTFTSAEDMARSILGPIPIGWLLSVKLASVKKIKELDVPVLFLHGNRDSVVPFALGKKLFAAAPAPKEFYEIDGADHNDTYIVGGKPYFEKLRRFILKNL